MIFTLKLFGSIFVTITVVFFMWRWLLIRKFRRNSVTILAIKHNCGRLCNQLWNFTNLYSYCLEKKYRFYNPSFHQYAHYFPRLQYNVGISPANAKKNKLFYVKKLHYYYWKILRHLFLKTKKNIRIEVKRSDNRVPLPPTPSNIFDNKYQYQYQYQYFIDKKEYSEADDLFFSDLKPGLYTLHGWKFYNPIGIDKFRQELLALFKPRSDIITTIDAFWEDIEKEKLVIGVHIRHTDYKEFENGARFISIAQYREYMGTLAKRYNHYNPLFIIYSDEHRNNSEFPGMRCKISKGNMIEDLYSMAKCDLIIGPRSTYSKWAAWYGDAILYILNDKNIDFEFIDNDVKDKMNDKNNTYNDSICRQQKYSAADKLLEEGF
ncbi:MAG: hypothetical protein HN411_00395 [Waddliaceae bacterium]|jgi:hypothetical protein|nr:hypothetical protein [Waddliaceae bacterium]MBT3579012.1 hypothetical protein [Waddliaceae bacterium]MBT4444541.1 hypothetical protein [Waddliaceae bacterium]MBT6928584.1 hypothetical protein [Waddliaceae bacterium]MBT7264263.1 hypothetical protein [Waddliaceae bacterium]